jgi:hypothetical protein
MEFSNTVEKENLAMESRHAAELAHHLHVQDIRFARTCGTLPLYVSRPGVESLAVTRAEEAQIGDVMTLLRYCALPAVGTDNEAARVRRIETRHITCISYLDEC